MPTYSFDFEDGEPLVIGGIKLPRYGSLTVGESIAFAELKDKATSAAIATLMFRSRVDPHWGEEQTNRIPSHLIGKVVDFFLGEARQWREATEETAEAEGE